MTFLIVIATILLILDCLLLSLLVMVQLPKKDAGMGMAFGGGAADALFGAGSGTALSNLTKYAAIGFFALVFALAILNNHAQHSSISELRRQMEQQSAATPASQAPATRPAPAGNAAPAIPLSISTNTASPAVTPASNAIPAK